MAKIDVYLRSIKQLGAQGAILTSGQAVTLRFPTGDRHATQITSHDQLLGLVREVAPPGGVLDQLDRNRAVRFEIDANGARWAIQVLPKPGAWQVAIDPVDGVASAVGTAPPGPSGSGSWGAAAAPGAAGIVPSAAVPHPSYVPGNTHNPPIAARSPSGRAPTPPPIPAQPDPREDMPIERGQYAAPAPVTATSGSAMLDALTAGARAARATDVYLSAGSPAFQRVGSELVATADRAPIDGETIARELGTVAPAEARAAWSERGLAVFAYGDGAGRVRVTLTRDHRGPGAALRVLPAEAPPIAAIGLAAAADWLVDRGLIVVAGASGTGKTTTLAALVRALGEQRRRVVAIEQPIEIVHVSPWISQRAVGEHVPSVADGVAAAMREAADAIVIGAVQTPADATAVFEAVAGGHLVLTTLVAPRAGVALERVVDRLPADQRDLARALCGNALLGTIGTIVTRAGRSFELAGRGIVS